MKRQIVILCALLALVAGPAVGAELGSQTWECAGPPWGVVQCDEYRCGETVQVGFVKGGWVAGAIELVVKSEGQIEIDFTWVPAEGGEQLGTRQVYLDAGVHSFPKLDVVKEIFQAEGTHVGGLIIDWRSCGDSVLYADAWAERTINERDGGLGQRSYINDQLICPAKPSKFAVSVYLGLGVVDGCYEIPVAPDTEYVRTQLLSTSTDSWQTMWIDGQQVDVVPLDPQYPELTMFNFIPSGPLIEVCYGEQPPWSGSDWTPACIWASLEGIDADAKRRLSVPLRPLVLLP